MRRTTVFAVLLASTVGVTGCGLRSPCEINPTTTSQAGECIEADGEPCDDDPCDSDDLNDSGTSHRKPTRKRR